MSKIQSVADQTITGAVQLMEEIRRYMELTYKDSRIINAPMSQSLERLLSKNEAEQSQLLSDFRDRTRPIRLAIESDPTSISDERRLLKRIAHQTGWIFSDELYSHLHNGDLLEIYRKDFIQTYCGLGFMDLCNYHLVDLLTHEFHELYERSASINERIFKWTQILEAKGTLDPVHLTDIPRHLMREKFSEANGTFEIHFRYAFPVYQWPRTYYGFAVIQSARPYSDVDGTLKNVRFL